MTKAILLSTQKLINNWRLHNSAFQLLRWLFLQHKNQNCVKFTQPNKKTQFRKLWIQISGMNRVTKTRYVLYFVVEEILQSCSIDTAEVVFVNDNERTRIQITIMPIPPLKIILDKIITRAGSCWGIFGEDVSLLALVGFLTSLAFGSSLSSPASGKYGRINLITTSLESNF